MASQPYIGYIVYIDFFLSVHILEAHTFIIPEFLCIISGFLFPWIFFSVRSDLITPSFEILMVSIRCLPGFFLAPPTPIPIHNPAITKILSCLTVSLFFQGNLTYLKQQNLYSFLLAFWLLLLVWSFQLNFLS